MHARVGFERSCSLSHKKASIRSNGKELSLLSESINEALYYSMYVYISFTELYYRNKTRGVCIIERNHHHLPCAGRSLIFIFIFGVLTPLSAIFQLYHGDQL
jgi:hypothetical protein